MGELTAEERGLLSDWWLSGSEGDLFAVVESILAARRESLAERVREIHTHNGTPVTAENLEWAATHETLCRSWIFDVLVGLAALLDDPALPSRAHGNGPRSDAEAGTGSRGHREPERGSESQPCDSDPA
jgi:hypothetical protein